MGWGQVGSTNSGSQDGGTSLSVPILSGAGGDLLLLSVGGSVLVNPTSGWNLIANLIPTATPPLLPGTAAAQWRISDGTETTATVTGSAQNWTYSVTRLRNNNAPIADLLWGVQDHKYASGAVNGVSDDLFSNFPFTGTDSFMFVMAFGRLDDGEFGGVPLLHDDGGIMSMRTLMSFSPISPNPHYGLSTLIDISGTFDNLGDFVATWTAGGTAHTNVGIYEFYPYHITERGVGNLSPKSRRVVTGALPHEIHGGMQGSGILSNLLGQ